MKLIPLSSSEINPTFFLMRDNANDPLALFRPFEFGLQWPSEKSENGETAKSVTDIRGRIKNLSTFGKWGRDEMEIASRLAGLSLPDIPVKKKKSKSDQQDLGIPVSLTDE